MPVIGKRARRDYIHDRLYRQSLITREEHDAAEDWARLHALAAGARIGESRPLEKIDGRSGSEPAEWTVDALTALRSQYRRVGHWGSAVLVLAICDGASLRAVARQFCGGDGGRACEAAEALIVGALGRLAKTLDVRRD
ncbi:MAG: hypothetical protein B7Z68_00685 [Acidobacteria bacterium 21-70-11]|nr:MAG: hypothetical protein B7Z68_00685 [Acidobacteria bacterium 21-70-11]